MDPIKQARSFLIIMTIIFTIVLIFPGTPDEDSLLTILLFLIGIPSVSYTISLNYKKIPKIYSLLEIIVVLFCSILLIYTALNYLT